MRILHPRNDRESVFDTAFGNNLDEFIHLYIVRFRLKLQDVPEYVVFRHHDCLMKYCRGVDLAVDSDFSMRNAIFLKTIRYGFKFLFFFAHPFAQVRELLFRRFEFLRCRGSAGWRTGPFQHDWRHLKSISSRHKGFRADIATKVFSFKLNFVSGLVRARERLFQCRACSRDAEYTTSRSH